MGVFNAHRAKLRPCGLEDTLKDMNASWKRMSETVAFKKGVAGFIRTTEVTRERMATCEHIPTITPYCWLSLAISQKIILNSLSGSKCGKKPKSRLRPKRERQDG